ncbi:E3 ubiquitin-protein ligase FANCL isoform X2 [Atheta coriaria]|uniref:E3 ubiquitin-protein ligase FANCL isoform X2 n=1 Tax=Dalotia coriaria TaxID=877792 RepID=UPI0031F45B16
MCNIAVIRCATKMEILLNYPGLQAVRKHDSPMQQSVREYKGLLFVNDKSFKIHLHQSNSTWLMHNPTDDPIIYALNSQNFKHAWNYLDAYKKQLEPIHLSHQPVPVDIYRRVIQEHQEFVNFHIYLKTVQLASDLSHITIIYVDGKFRNHQITITVNYNQGKLFQIGCCKLPVTLSASDDSLINLFEVFVAQVENFQQFFDVMDVIDQFLWTVDPEMPTRADVRRRVILDVNLSVEMVFNPNHPMTLPEMRLFGPVGRVQQIESVLNNNFESWSEDGDVIDELTKIFEVAVFPERGSLDKECGIGECGICLSTRGHSSKLPEVFCPNSPCDQCFHTDCLYKFLQQSLQEYSTKVQGSCPYCKQRITCENPQQ